MSPLKRLFDFLKQTRFLTAQFAEITTRIRKSLRQHQSVHLPLETILLPGVHQAAGLLEQGNNLSRALLPRKTT